MRPNIQVLSLIILALTIRGQNRFIDKDYDCKLLDWHYKYIRHPNKIDTALNKVECLVIRGRFDKGMNMLDSLTNVYPDSGYLYRRKAYYLRENNSYDTSYFALIRKTLDLNFQIGPTSGAFADFCFNYVVACEDPKSPTKLSNAKKKEILDLSEKYCLKAILLDNRWKHVHLELLTSVKEKRNEISGNKPQELKFNSKFDTLLLISELKDCGEFGGHLEYIKLYHTGKNIVGEFSQDPPYCQGDMQPEIPPYKSYKKGPQNIDSISVKSYLNHIKSINKHPDWFTNAPTSFWIIDGQTIFFVRDWTGNKKEYERLRDRMFK